MDTQVETAWMEKIIDETMYDFRDLGMSPLVLKNIILVTMGRTIDGVRANIFRRETPRGLWEEEKT